MLFDPLEPREQPDIEDLARCWKGAVIAAALSPDALARALSISEDDACAFKTWAAMDVQRLKNETIQ